jgi:hypothetical protein
VPQAHRANVLFTVGVTHGPGGDIFATESSSGVYYWLADGTFCQLRQSDFQH